MVLQIKTDYIHLICAVTGTLFPTYPSHRKSIMTFVVCTVSRKRGEHGFDIVVPLQAANAVTVGTGGNLGIVLAVGGKAHNAIPVKTLHLGQVIAVETSVVGKNGTGTVLLEPETQIHNSFDSGAENGLHRCFQKQHVIVHAAYLTLDGQI